MKVNRDFATSLTIGTFLLMAVTGVLMFFHLDTGVNKLAHEWIGLVMVFGVLLHLTANMISFKRYFRVWQGRALMGLFAVGLAISFLPIQGGGKPPFVPVIEGLSSRPLAELAVFSGDDRLQQVLREAGLEMASDEQTLRDLTGKDFGKQMQVLGKLLKTAE